MKKDNKNRSLSENRKAPLDCKKVKIKDVFEGENLFEVPKDGILDTPPLKERSTLPIEMT